MTALRADDFRHHSDTLHLRSGQRLTLRFAEPDDAEALQSYVRGLSHVVTLPALSRRRQRVAAGPA